MHNDLTDIKDKPKNRSDMVGRSQEPNTNEIREITQGYIRKSVDDEESS